MPISLRQGGLQVDWRDDVMVVMADYNTEFVFIVVQEEGSYRVLPAMAPIPEVSLGEFTKSFDVSLLTTVAPVRFLLAESRPSELMVTMCTEGDGLGQARCVRTMDGAEVIEADDQVQTAFVPGDPAAVMVGFSKKGGAAAAKRVYSSRAVILNTPVTLGPGNVFVSIDNQDVSGVDFSHVPETSNRFLVAGGALTAGFFRYASSTSEANPEPCGALDTVFLTPYKVKTQHDSPKVLFRTRNGLMLTDCMAEPGPALTQETIWDFDFVPVDRGDVAVWIDGKAAEKAVRGAVIRGSTTTRLTFRDDDRVHHFVRMGKIGNDIVVVFGGAQEGLMMIRGTEEELISCYGR